MPPELEAPPPDERDGAGPWDADDPDDLERAPDELGQPQPPAQLIRHLEQSFQGPLPSPEAFASYEQTVPGAGDRILRLAEEEATHRRSQEIAEGEHGRQLQDFDVRQAATRQNRGLHHGRRNYGSGHRNRGAWEYHRGNHYHHHGRTWRDGNLCVRLTLAAQRSSTPAGRR